MLYIKSMSFLTTLSIFFIRKTSTKHKNMSSECISATTYHHDLTKIDGLFDILTKIPRPFYNFELIDVLDTGSQHLEVVHKTEQVIWELIQQELNKVFPATPGGSKKMSLIDCSNLSESLHRAKIRQTILNISKVNALVLTIDDPKHLLYRLSYLLRKCVMLYSFSTL